ncbi:hypothetical protein [Zooshikella ganghwensis]|uniref:DUF1834 family protein n=1 Tax=Zooshikella ganghwensis TaxID=202772 RepID=A0A4P9VGP3_9GAMM|nr:hypothetical protein [Zooshikella ganghwensis]RDH41596.1 hypothetical protein B9G39_27420 [Zooshikella ganghwensis]
MRSAILDFCYWGDLALVPKQPDNPQPKTPINSLLAAIQTELSDIATAQLASHQCAIFDLPLIRLKLDQVKPASDLDDWDGRQVMQCYFTAYAYHMVGYAEDLAIRLVSAIKFNQWGMGESVSTPISIEANQNSVAWGYKPYEVWRISWQQSLALSQSIWNDDGEPPTTVLASHEPKTGKAHEPEYETPLIPKN